jgi:teichuronic acid biosynthesis glycosyltransferase TuaC
MTAVKSRAGDHVEAPAILVFSSLFPSRTQPNAGVFIRERMFRVGQRLPVTVVAPQPWFPLQGLLRHWKPHFRPGAPLYENQQGVDVYHPRFFCVPAVAKRLDGLFMALGSYFLVRRLQREKRLRLIDAHFAYPDGYAATLLGKWLKLPVIITMRGTEVPLSRYPARRRRILTALRRASAVIAVADSLRQHVAALGFPGERVCVIGNGVDTEKFHPVDRLQARRQLGINADATVIISVGGLVERKGHHRVLEVLPALREQFPGLLYLIVGGASAEGDWRERLEQQVRDLDLEDAVRFLGVQPQEELKVPLSAADLFVLPTQNEGWANVFLEAMACGLPIVTTDVGGNREVVCSNDLGIIISFNNMQILSKVIAEGLRHHWERDVILQYARNNSWDDRVARLEALFRGVVEAV